MEERDTVRMYLVGGQSGDTGDLYYALEYKGHVRQVYIPVAQDTTLNRSMLRIIATVLGELKRPCNLVVYAKNALGYKKLFMPNKYWVNRDVGNELMRQLKSGGHHVEIIQTKPGTPDYEKLLYLDGQIYKKRKAPR